MSSKTGWTLVQDEDFFYGVWGRAESPDDAYYRRVCVRVDECPKTIKRSELPRVLKRGCEIQINKAGYSDDFNGLSTNGFVIADAWLVTEVFNNWPGVYGIDHYINPVYVTAIRPHSEAQWTKVED